MQTITALPRSVGHLDTLPGILEPLEPRIAPAVFVVTNANDVDAIGDPDGYVGTLRWAIAQTELNPNRADKIVFDPDVFVHDILAKGNVIELNPLLAPLPTITGNLTIQGLGPDRVAIDAGGAYRIFTIDDGNPDVVRTVSITGLALTGGFSANGGAVFSMESLKISDSIISGNNASEHGGGVFFDSIGKLTIKNTVFTDNSAFLLGGGVAATAGSSVHFTGVLFAGNDALSGGGASVLLDGDKTSLVVKSSDFINNSATDFGGGLRVSVDSVKASLQIQQTQFVENSAVIQGGGMSVEATSADLLNMRFDKAVFAHNSAGEGGGLRILAPAVADSRLTVQNSEFHLNRADGVFADSTFGHGGAMRLEGVQSAVFKNSHFAGNTVAPAEIGGNYYGGLGGAIYAIDTKLTAKGLHFSGNSAFHSGGAVALADNTDATFSKSVFTGNQVDPSSPGDGFGGAIFSISDRISLDRSQFEGNEARDGLGGAVWFEGDGDFLVSKSQFHGNEADLGGAISGVFNGFTSIVKSDFQANLGGEGAGAVAAKLHDSGSFFEFVSNNVRGNSGSAAGGGMVIETVEDAFAYIFKSTFHHNGTGGDGGAMLIQGKGDVMVQKSTITGNVAINSGGGIFALVEAPGFLEICHTTISGNLAGQYGGGIFNLSPAKVILDTANISGNFAGNGFTMAYANISGDFDGYSPVQSKAQKGTFVVTNLDDNGAGSLRQAILDANDSGKKATIVFDSELTGKGKGIITLEDALPEIEHGIAIKGPGADQIAIHGDDKHRILHFNSSGDGIKKSSVSGLALMNGFADVGKGHGGAIYNAGDTLTLSQLMFFGNKAAGGGGAFYNDTGTLKVQDSVFVGNEAAEEGGAIFAWSASKMEFRNNMISGNISGDSGGGLHLETFDNAKKVLVTGTTLLANEAATSGGGLFADFFSENGKSRNDIQNTIFLGNLATDGAGLYIHGFNGGKTTLSGGVLANNVAVDSGGGAFLQSDNQLTKFAIRDVGFFRNEANHGGGLFAVANTSDATSMMIQKSSFVGNHAQNSGGGMFVLDQASSYAFSVSLKHTTLAGNTAAAGGGGAFVDETAVLNISNSLLTGNTAMTNAGGGVSAVDGSVLQIAKSTISGNSGDSGGGVSARFGASLELSKSTLTGNSAGPGTGGAVNSANYASTLISKSQLNANTALHGGAMYLRSVSALDATIVQSTHARGNFAQLDGGGMHSTAFASGSASFTALALTHNAAGMSGGGVFLDGMGGTQTFSNSSLQSNAALDGAGGGLRMVNGQIGFIGGAITGNSATTTGGGVAQQGPGSSFAVSAKTDFSGNWAPAWPNFSL